MSHIQEKIQHLISDHNGQLDGIVLPKEEYQQALSEGLCTFYPDGSTFVYGIRLYCRMEK